MKKMVKKKMGGKVKKYEDGGPGPVTRQDIKQAKMQAKLNRINAGTEPSTYEKVANITGNVAKTAASAAQVADAVRDTRTGMSGPGGMKKGGSVRKYQDGGMTGFERRQAKKVGRAETKATVAKIEGEGTVAQKRDNRAKRVSTMAGTARAKTPRSVSTSTSTSNSTSTVNNNEAPRTPKTTPGSTKTTGKTVTKPNVPAGKPKPEYTRTSVKTVNKDSVKSPVRYKTGGMVNSNAKVSALKSAGSKGVKSGVNPKAAASKVARGRVGGTSSAPKTAVPKAKYGMVMRKK
jgi:hypothetical protein